MECYYITCVHAVQAQVHSVTGTVVPCK